MVCLQTAPALIYNLYCLGANEFAQEKLYDEIKANVIGRGALTSDILQNMPYLKACVKEAFRFLFTVYHNCRKTFLETSSLLQVVSNRN